MGTPISGEKSNITNISQYFEGITATIPKMSPEESEKVVDLLLKASRQGRTIFLFGNGGSAALASHMACDLGKGTSGVADRRLRVLALTDNTPLITAWANDTHYEHIFAEQLSNLVEAGDIAFAISGSGNSPNVLNALRLAKERGAVTIGLAGFAGGKMKPLCDVCVVVPSDNMQIIEDLHTITAHGIFTVMRSRLQAPRAMAATAG